MIMGFGLILIFLVLGLFFSYFGTCTVEYRNSVYTIQFNEIDENFGNVTIGKNYYCWRNAYYRFWKSSEVFHYFDDDGVNKYINIYDPILKKCTFDIK